jgi:hypothetical protein
LLYITKYRIFPLIIQFINHFHLSRFMDKIEIHLMKYIWALEYLQEAQIQYDEAMIVAKLKGKIDIELLYQLLALKDNVLYHETKVKDLERRIILNL